MNCIRVQRRKSPDSTNQSQIKRYWIICKIQNVLWIKPVSKLGRVSNPQRTLTKKKKKEQTKKMPNILLMIETQQYPFHHHIFIERSVVSRMKTS